MHDVTAALEALPSVRWPYPAGDALVARLDELRPRLEAEALRAAARPLASLRLESPVANPPRIIAVRTNYRGEGTEPPADTEPDLFLKSASSVVGPAAGVELRFPDRRTDHEVELAVIIGRRADRVAPEAASGFVAGYCVGIDFTLRGSEDRSLRKSLAGYTVLGPWLTTPDEAGEVGGLRISLSVNSRVRQDGRTDQMIHRVPELIAHASRYLELLPGDVLLTGTPAGVGPVASGDRIECAIERLGEMRLVVR